MAKYTIDR
jgi:hypothetical protein